MSKWRNVFFLERPTCLGFKNVKKGLTKQQTNSGIKITLKCSCSLSSSAGGCLWVFSLFPCRFTKNLSPDKINLSTLKGQGQLTNLELDEEVLQNVLELPTWLAITRVYCNKASIRVSRGNFTWMMLSIYRQNHWGCAWTCTLHTELLQILPPCAL